MLSWSECRRHSAETIACAKVIKKLCEDYPQLFASLIARTAKDIDVLIDSLPSEEASPELQAANLRRLEVENQEAARRLEEVVQQGEALLEQIQKALHDIAESQLSMQHLDEAPPN
ncbi:hypothetical protein HPB49_020022 [Dermacentor silvarum]|uniref:Uncharacterized protein n=1 Tax=Dermacentor silvarum TaxID=543639 RepID=A0ACB8DFV0_DERSI|nr:hypothetical protein HPB49_020022 [Dermacentor silvarum]